MCQALSKNPRFDMKTPRHVWDIVGTASFSLKPGMDRSPGVWVVEDVEVAAALFIHYVRQLVWPRGFAAREALPLGGKCKAKTCGKHFDSKMAPRPSVPWKTLKRWGG